jgi:cytochrome c peroxidase
VKFSGKILRNIMVAAASLTVLLYGCKKDKEKEPEEQGDPSLANIVFSVPKGWPQAHYNFENNTLTKEGFKLGRKLFFEPRLSSDNKVSCGSCHQPFSAFAQLDHAISHGVNEQLGIRNSPALFNLNWHTSFFWDGGVNHIENQPAAPITNPVEMNETLAGIVAKLENDAVYKKMFKDAFGDETINTQRIFKAMAQFMGMLVSSNSKYDKYTRNEEGGSMSQQELDGLTVFRSKCAGCHTEPLFTDFSLRNNGLELVTGTTGTVDKGRGVIEPLDSTTYYKFKVPSLRNLKYTAPYMHDGRFTTLDAVLEHYSNEIYQTPNLDPALTNGIILSGKEKADLKAFLNTLNDESFVKDIRFLEAK